MAVTINGSTGVQLDDDDKQEFGTGDDLKIYHSATGNKSYITHSGAGAFDIASTGDNLVLKSSEDIYLMPHDSENGLYVGKNGSVKNYYDNALKFETTTEGTITTGYNKSFLVSSDSAYTSTTAHIQQSNANNQMCSIIEHSGDTNPYGLLISFTDNSPDNNSNYYLKCDDSSNTNRLYIYSDGDVVNHDNSYGSTSDIKLKENIVDAGSQWNDIKAVKVRNFNFKSDTPSDKRLGVIAQELETISPGLVSTNPDLDKDNNDLGTTTKSVKYSILYMKAIKALQEAMAKIETLETKVAALEAHTHE